MIRRKTTTRAESVVLSYILVLGIMTVLSTLLIASASGYLQTQHQSVTETQAEITAEAIASEVEEVDKLARKVDSPNSDKGTITFRSQADKLIGQYPYKVRFESHPRPDTYQVIVSVSSKQVDVREVTNVTIYELNNIETGDNSTGSSLTYKYTENGTLRLEETTDLCVVNSSGSYTISSSTEIDGCITAVSTISGGQGAIIYGNITSTNDEVNLQEDIIVNGDISSDSDTVIDRSSLIAGSVTAGANLLISQDTVVGGGLDAGSDIQLGNNVSISGQITSDNDIVLGQNNDIQSSIIAESSVGIPQDSIVRGSVTTNIGDIQTGTNVTIQDELSAGDDIVLGQNNHIESNITTDAILVSSGTQVNATIDGNSVALDDDTIVKNDVLVPDGSQLSCGTNVTINGQSCSDYKDANY